MLFKWRSAKIFNTHQLPSQVADYLLDSASLTARLTAASKGDFRVQLLQQGMVKPRMEEARLLNLDRQQWAWVREVILYCHGQPWVYARSVVPLSSLKGRLGFLRQLRHSALGTLLFKDPQLSRSDFEICSMETKDFIINGFIMDAGTVYGRRSVFHLYRKPILVAEHFLPACQL